MDVTNTLSPFNILSMPKSALPPMTSAVLHYTL